VRSGDGFKLTAAALEEAVSSDTKWLLLNSPSNPTGAVYSPVELAELAEVLRRHPSVLVLSDDIYEKLVYGAVEFATMASVAPDLADRTLTVNGVSKTYAMTGWRVGYGAGPADLIAAMNTIQSQTTSHTSSISQHAAVAALSGEQGFLEEIIATYDYRRHLVVGALNESKFLNVILPDGAFYLYVDCSELIGSSTPQGQPIASDVDLASYLLEHASVAVVPGTGFLASAFFRISYAAATDDLERGCAQIVDSLNQLT